MNKCVYTALLFFNIILYSKLNYRMFCACSMTKTFVLPSIVEGQKNFLHFILHTILSPSLTFKILHRQLCCQARGQMPCWWPLSHSWCLLSSSNDWTSTHTTEKAARDFTLLLPECHWPHLGFQIQCVIIIYAPTFCTSFCLLQGNTCCFFIAICVEFTLSKQKQVSFEYVL